MEAHAPKPGRTDTDSPIPDAIRKAAVSVADRIPVRYRPPVFSLARALSGLRAYEAEITDAEQADAFVVFVGHARSGSTLVAALLTAHPDVVLSMEVDVLNLMRFGVNRRMLLGAIFERDRWWGEAGRKWEGYEYQVPNQWQGRYRDLRVVGDKKAMSTAKQLRRDPSRLDDLRALFGLPLRVVQVVRNPFDNITTMARRHGQTLAYAADRYFEHAEGVQAAKRHLAPGDDFVAVRHEDVIGDAATQLKDLCEFLGVAPEAEYLSDCADIVFSSPSRTRDSAPWPPALVDRVDRGIAQFDFLSGYSFDS